MRWTRGRSRLLPCFAVVVFGLLNPWLERSARAGDPAAADALFKEALALLDQKDWEHACPKFQASWDFDPSVSTLINLSRCREHEGKLATALGQLAEAARMNRERSSARQEQLATYIDKLTKELDPRVPRVRITVSGPAASDLVLERDGAAMPTSALGQAIPLDPGEHVLVARAPGFVEKTTRFTAKEGPSSEVNVTLERAPDKPLDKPGDKPLDGGNKPPPKRDAPSSGLGAQSIAGIAVMGAGGAGLVVGGVLAGLAGGKAGKIPDTCSQDPFVCPSDAETATANDASQTGQGFLTGSIVGFSAGAALLATGVIVFATDSPSEPGASAPVTARFSPLLSPDTIGVRGSLRW